MSDWIHCNKCFKQPNTNADKFDITDCGHFICAACASDKPGYCFICHNECNITSLNENLNENVQCYFESIDEQLSEIKKCLKIMDFQKTHRQNFFAYLFQTNAANSKELETVTFKYNAAKEYIKKIALRNEQLQKENKRLKDIIKNNTSASKSSSKSSIQDALIRNGQKGKTSFAINLKSGANLTRGSENLSFLSNKNEGSNINSSASSIRSSYFLHTPSPAIDNPFKLLFINSDDSNPRKLD